MIFPSLAEFIKPHLNKEEPIYPLLALCLKQKIKQKSTDDHSTRLIQEAFFLQELSRQQYCIKPKNQKAIELLKLMQEYIQVMETTRFARWLQNIEPKDFYV